MFLITASNFLAISLCVSLLLFFLLWLRKNLEVNRLENENSAVRNDLLKKEESISQLFKEDAELQSKLSQIQAQQKNIEEQKTKLQEKNKKIWSMGEAALKEKRKADELNTQLNAEREKLETEKKRLDEKVKKLWQTSTAIHKEKERINSLYEQIEEAKKKSDELLLNILPEEAAEELKANGYYEPRLFDDVSVLFTDFKNFTTYSERLSARELVNELNVCFKAFDEITAKYNIEKIKTIGDAYLAASGLPTANINHAEDIIKAAMEIRDFMKNRRTELGDDIWEIRIGIHSGSVVAGIVGAKKYLYDIWGDAVNTAARMEQNSEAGKINISEVTYHLVIDKFNFEYRGEIEAKNKGKMKMYFVN